MFEHFLGGTVEPLHFGNESVIGKIEYRIFLAGCGGSPATGEKEPPGQSETSPTQLPRQFKTDECAHAMPEQNIWKLGLTHDEICNSLNQRFKASKRLPTNAFAPTWKMNEA